MLKNFLFNYTPLILCALFFGTAASGQQIRTYQGPYNFYGYDGVARYEFFRERKDSTVKSGQFDFSRKYTDSVDTQIFHKLLASGKYRENRKSGRWQFIESRHKVTVKDVVYFNVKASLESEQSEITANFNNTGTPHGQWSYKMLRYADEKIIDLLSSEGLTFEDGSVSGPFRFYSDRTEGYYGLYDIKGRTTADGLMDSLWVLNYMRDTLQVKEHRYYDQGFLTEIVKIEGNGGVDTMFHHEFTNVKNKLKILSDGKGTALFKKSERDFGMDFMSGFDRDDKRYKTQLHGNNYLKEIFEHITRFNTRYYYGDEGQIKSVLKTKRFEFSSLPKDDSLRSEASRKHAELIDIVEGIKNSNTFGLNRKRTDSLNYANEYFILIDSLLSRMDYVIRKAGGDQYKYFDAYSYIREKPFGYMTTDTVRFTYEGSEYTLQSDFNKGISEDASLPEHLDKFMSHMLEEAKKMREIINRQMQQIKIGDELQELQQEIITSREELLNQFGTIKFIHKDEKAMFQSVKKTFLEERFESFTEDYSKDDLESGKVDKATDYINMMEDLENMIRPMGSVYRNRKLLDSLYMEEVFNPFTYTSYDRRVKEELFKKSEVLFQTYIDTLKAARTSEELSDILGKIESLQNRLEYLRDRDTRAVERALRGTKTPAELERIIEVGKEPDENAE